MSGRITTAVSDAGCKYCRGLVPKLHFAAYLVAPNVFISGGRMSLEVGVVIHLCSGFDAPVMCGRFSDSEKWGFLLLMSEKVAICLVYYRFRIY